MKKKIGIGILTMACAVSALAGVGGVSAVAEELTGMTAMEITHEMGKGWNLGNTFDANGGNRDDVYSQEQSWGNPKVTKELIDGVKAAGFDTIRIPVTWYKHVTPENNYKIDEDFMARVTEVVDYAYENDMYVIINVHHEEWVNDPEIDKNYVKIGEELVAIWEQIAENFADYDQHLIFEGMNEPRAQGTSYEWNGVPACYDAVNYLNQCFVSTIREEPKGNNGERALMIPGYAASSNPNVLRSIVIPELNGAQAENVIVSVHCYAPYEFCLTDKQDTFNPNSSSDTADITTLMKNIQTMFLNKDIPVVIGECGATNSNDNDEARKAWFTYFGDITREYGVPAVLWDNGAIGKSGGECHNYFERKSGAMAYPELLSRFIYGNLENTEAKDMFIDFEPYKEDGVTIMATPEEYGFEPSNMTKKKGVNHTPDALLGLSAVVTVADEDSYCTMDMSKFAGKNVNVKIYLTSDATDTVSVGVCDPDETELVSASIDTDWSVVSFNHKFAEEAGNKCIYFRGTKSADFYIDDISITIVEDGETMEAYAAKDGDEIVEAAATEGEVIKANEDGADDATKSTKSRTPIVIIILVAAIVILVAANRAKKKK